MTMMTKYSVQQLIKRALSQLESPSAHTGRVIHLALSGGVDSSVAGFLLKEAGWDVRPVLMRCWSDAEDEGNDPCFEREVRESEAAVKALGLRRSLAIFDFVPEYWSMVFDDVFLKGLASGLTPNQDLVCNSAIKFGAFPQRLAAESSSSSPPPFATGHYARLAKGNSEASSVTTDREADTRRSQVRLLRAFDRQKDQSYFLAGVSGASLEKAVFPVGILLKSEVRQIASYVGLPAATQRSSRGICFVGKRRIGDFASRYLPNSTLKKSMTRRDGSAVNHGNFLAVNPKHGEIFKVERLLCPVYSYTLGQRARIGGQLKPLYVTGRRGNDIIVNENRLFVRQLVCDSPSWVAGDPPRNLNDLKLSYKGFSSAEDKPCNAEIGRRGLLVQFQEDTHAIAPGQAIVLYNGDEVLCAALVSKNNYEGDIFLKATQFQSS